MVAGTGTGGRDRVAFSCRFSLWPSFRRSSPQHPISSLPSCAALLWPWKVLSPDPLLQPSSPKARQLSVAVTSYAELSEGLLLMMPLHIVWTLVLLLLLPREGAEGAPAAYDEGVAQTLAEYSGAAYACDVPRCAKWQCVACRLHPNIEILRFGNDTEGASGFVGYDRDLEKIIIAFSGTHINVATWINNVNPAVVDYPCPNCQVHEGFLGAYESMSKDLLKNLAYLLSLHPAADIWVTGHSLGGALATLCVADLHANQRISTQTVITFGQPRVGNGPFASWFVETLDETPFFRVVHNADPIPHAPPSLLGFVHSPVEIFYNAGETAYRICDETGEDPTCSDKYIWPWTLNAADHLEYLSVAM